jgi:magnesium chelatase family protein
MRAAVVAARQIQTARFAGSAVRHNGQMTHRQIRQFCQLDEAGMNLLRSTMSELGLSARAHDKILRVARTIADLEMAESLASGGGASPDHAALATTTSLPITAMHVNEAINYRMLDRNLWK